MYELKTIMTGVTGAPYYSTMYFSDDQRVGNDRGDVVAAFWTALRSQLVSTLRIEVQGTWRIIDAATGNQTGEYAGQPIVVQGQASATLAQPPATQAYFNWLTDNFSNGRRLRGRTFVPGLGQGASAGGAPSPNLVTAMQAATQALVLGNDGIGFGVYSRTNRQFSRVTSVNYPTKFGVLRSRRD